jgi:hypothetical protein
VLIWFLGVGGSRFIDSQIGLEYLAVVNPILGDPWRKHKRTMHSRGGDTYLVVGNDL